jgi:NitT/TauT family transport system substrate-binding protein
LLTIGITNDESYGNALVATAKTADGFVKNPASIKGQTIVLTANSTGDYAVQSCLAKWGLKKSDVTGEEHGAGRDHLGDVERKRRPRRAVGARTRTRWKRRPGAKQICSGQDAGAAVPGALIVRADYAKEQPQNVAKFLAVYLRAWKWLNAHQPEAIAMMKKFYEQGGVTISEASMKKEFTTRPTYDLAGQLKIMNRPRAVRRSRRVVHQDRRVHAGERHVPRKRRPASKFITDEYLSMVDADPKLKAFANRAD